MDVQTAELFFAMLSLAVLAGTAALLACRLLATTAGAARFVVDAIRPFTTAIASVIAVTAMLGSLYFSEVAQFVPCTLCWYQRIAMYPLGIILAIASVRRDRTVRVYVAPVAAIGAAISLYHWLLERFPDLDAGACSAAVPCEFVWFEKFGFVTLPFMALAAFVAVIALTTIPDKA